MKRFFIGTLSALLIVLVAIGSLTVVIDPFFHYHAPLKKLAYPINNQRYQNDGILRNFDYDAIITGTSMTENFKTSEMNKLFDTNSVKVSFSGSYLKETSDRLSTAFSKKQIKYVVRSLDLYAISADKDYISEYDYPSYLYNDVIFDDVRYFLNKSVLFSHTVEVLKYSRENEKTTSFDECYNWSNNFSYGKQPVLERYSRAEKTDVKATLSDLEKKTIKENLEQNIIQLARENPNTEFLYFYPPYSIVWWDMTSQNGITEKNIEIMKCAWEILSDCDNIYLYSFNDNFETICNLDNYKDLEHYGQWINSYILQSMKSQNGLLTKENGDLHFEKILKFYSEYDYDAIF